MENPNFFYQVWMGKGFCSCFSQENIHIRIPSTFPFPAKPPLHPLGQYFNTPLRTHSCTHLPQPPVPRITCVLHPTPVLCLYTLLHLSLSVPFFLSSFEVIQSCSDGIEITCCIWSIITLLNHGRSIFLL